MTSDWDIDLRDGKLGENKVAKLLTLETIEVKTDRRWIETGNVFIETSCYYVNEEKWKPSGLYASKASHWAFVLEGNVIIVPREHLELVVNEFGRPIENKQPPNYSKGFLITPEQLINYRKIKNDEYKYAMEMQGHYMEQEYPI